MMRGFRRSLRRTGVAAFFGSLALALVVGISPAAAQTNVDPGADSCSGIFVPPVPVSGFDLSDHQSVVVRAFVVRGCDVDDVSMVVTYSNGLTWLQRGDDISLDDAPACTSDDASDFCTGATSGAE